MGLKLHLWHPLLLRNILIIRAWRRLAHEVLDMVQKNRSLHALDALDVAFLVDVLDDVLEACIAQSEDKVESFLDVLFQRRQ